MSYLISFASGIIGHGLPDSLDIAIEETIYRCNGLVTDANIVERETYKVVASVKWTMDGAVATKL